MANVIGVPWAGVSLPHQEPSFAQAVEGKLGANPTMAPLLGGLPSFGCTTGAPSLPILLI